MWQFKVTYGRISAIMASFSAFQMDTFANIPKLLAESPNTSTKKHERIIND